MLDTPKISAVMTLYKRPEVLLKQLEAIEQQTIKPYEVIIFQDKAIDNPVPFPTELTSRFQRIEISPVNKGVWGRFEFAQHARSPYVCVFDDDTIPGKKWFENCIHEMNRQEGIYGTNGICMFEPHQYPRKMMSIGWKTANPQRVEVDFVGHAWFFKKEWLSNLLNAPQSVQNLKICGEDMAFSFQCLKELGIKTFVPPHPIGDVEMFGSIPEHGYDYGGSDVGLSHNQTNIAKYNQAMNILLSQQWDTLFERFPNRRLLCRAIHKICQLIPLKSPREKIRCYYYHKVLQ